MATATRSGDKESDDVAAVPHRGRRGGAVCGSLCDVGRGSCGSAKTECKGGGGKVTEWNICRQMIHPVQPLFYVCCKEDGRGVTDNRLYAS